MSEWITDRMPTEADALEYTVLLWDGSKAVLWSYDGVNEGQPWAPIHKLIAPYVRKRWTVKWDDEWAEWNLLDDNVVVLVLDKKLTFEAAQRIADIYNEDMP